MEKMMAPFFDIDERKAQVFLSESIVRLSYT
jgi:hypothetical protein